MDDLKLHQKFLEIAYNGISMNLLTHQQPRKAYHLDAFPAMIRGYSGGGFSENLQSRATLNFLEFIASTIGAWINFGR